MQYIAKMGIFKGMKVLDLFSGIGGFSLAAHRLGWKTVAFVEKDLFCQKVLAKNFKGVPIYGDITEFSGRPFRGAVDVVTGGFPCQPFSQAGKREGTSDERHLFPEMLRIISEVRPRFAVAENVRGLLSIESGQVFADVVASLEGEGYEVVTFCIPASSVGAPHRRDRLWIVAHLQGNRIQKPKRQNRQSINGEFAESGMDFKRINSIASDTDNQRYFGRRKQGQTQKRAIRARCGIGQSFGESSINHSGIAGTLTDSESAECELSGYSRKRRTGFTNDDCALADPRRFGQSRSGKPGRYLRTKSGQEGQNYRAFDADKFKGNWLEAAGEFCRMDDGLPAELDASERKTIYNAVGYFGWEETGRRIGIDCSQVENFLHRTHRLKALGNSIVPQIAYEIFKAIEATS